MPGYHPRSVKKYLFRLGMLFLAAAGLYFFARAQSRQMAGGRELMPGNAGKVSFGAEDRVAMLELASKFGAAKTKIEKKLEERYSGPGYGVADAAEIAGLCAEAEKTLLLMRRDESYKPRLGELDSAETVRRQLFYECVKLKVMLGGPARGGAGVQQELRVVEALLYKMRLYLEGLGKN